MAKLERVIEYDANAMDSLSLILAVAKEYREADAAMKPALMKALQHFLNPPLICREVPDEPKPVGIPVMTSEHGAVVMVDFEAAERNARDALDVNAAMGSLHPWVVNLARAHLALTANLADRTQEFEASQTNCTRAMEALRHVEARAAALVKALERLRNNLRELASLEGISAPERDTYQALYRDVSAALGAP